MATTRYIPITIDVLLDSAKAKIKQFSDDVRGSLGGGKGLLDNLFASKGEDVIERLAGTRKEAAALGETLGAGAVTALGYGAAMGTAAAGVGVLILNQAKLASELRATANATGLSVETLQRYRAAEQVTGTATDTLSNAVDKLRVKGLEAQKGNKELALSLNQVGLSLTEATTRPAQSFEQLLNALQAMPNSLSRANAVTRIYGEDSRDLNRILVELTDNHGELRKEIDATGVAMSAHSAKALADLDRRYELLTLRVSTFAKSALVGLAEVLSNLDQAQAGVAQAGGGGFAAGKIGAPPSNGGRVTSQLIGPRLNVNAPLYQNDFLTNLPQLGFGASTLATGTGSGKKTRTGSGGSRGSRSGAKSDVELLVEQLADANAEIKTLGDSTSKQYQLKFSLEGLKDTRDQLAELLQLRAAAGLGGGVPGFDVNIGKGKTRRVTDFAGVKGQIAALSGKNLATAAGVDKLDESRLATLKVEKETLEQGADVLKEQLRIAELLEETTASLSDQLADLKGGGTGNSAELSTRRRLRNSGVSEEESAQAIAIAQKVDAEKQYQDALELGKQRQQEFSDFIRTQFDNLLDSPKRFFDGLKSLFKQGLSNLLTGLVTGGAGGGGGFFKSLAGLATGGAGGGGLSSLLLTPGFNPAAGASGAGAASGGLNGLLNGGGLIGAIAPKIAGLFGGGASALGGGISVGVGGGAAGAGAGAGGGALLGSLGALASNPITIGVAAAIGGYLAFRYFKNRGNYARDVKKAIQSQYGVEVSKDVVKQIEQIGKSRFGKNYKDQVTQTVALPEVRDLVAQYAEDTGQKGNDKLFNSANLGDPTYRDNRFVTSEAGRGASPGGGFVTTPNAGSGGASFVRAAQIGSQALLAQAITNLTNKISSIPASELITANAEAVGQAFSQAFDSDASLARKIGEATNP